MDFVFECPDEKVGLAAKAENKFEQLCRKIRSLDPYSKILSLGIAERYCPWLSE
jgi:hypothetical protein